MSPLDQPVLSLVGIDKRYGRQRVLDGLELTLARDEIVGLLGPNGCGKTTTLRIAAGYLWPDRGRVLLDGRMLDPDRPELRGGIGYLPERVALYTPFTVRRFLGFVAAARGLHGKARRAEVARVLRAFELESVAERVIARLSKGLRQRIGLAQALLGEPELLLLDEPTNGLDPLQLKQAREMIRAAAAGRGVVFSTHILQEVAALCTRVVYLHRGRLLEIPLASSGAAIVAVVVAGSDAAAALERVRALDAAIGVVREEPLAHGRTRLVFDLARARCARGELVRCLSAGGALEQVAAPAHDLEQALAAAIAGASAPATTALPEA